jgi:hypothetical protein
VAVHPRDGHVPMFHGGQRGCLYRFCHFSLIKEPTLFSLLMKNGKSLPHFKKKLGFFYDVAYAYAYGDQVGSHVQGD